MKPKSTEKRRDERQCDRPPKDFQALEPVDYIKLYGKMDFADVIRAMYKP